MSDPIEQRMDRIERVVGEMDNDLKFVASAIRGAQDEAPGAPARIQTDEWWCCSKCHAKIGIYDGSTDELRIRYRDFLVYVTPGSGGSVRVPCRGCGFDNVMNDTRAAATG